LRPVARGDDHVAVASRGKSKSLILFGTEVRRFRTAAGLSQDQTGTKIHVSGSHIGQIERGEVRCEEQTAKDLDGVLDSKGTLPSLWKQCVQNSVFPSWFDWPEVEVEATHLRTYQGMVIYGLLQTEDYASVLLRGEAQAVAARLSRQDILFREDPPPPRISVLMYEGVLHHQVGSPDIMRAQLDRLLTLSEAKNVSIQLIPGAVPSAGTVGSFVLATLPDRSEVAYADMAARGLTLNEADDIRVISDSYDEIRDRALPVQMSRDLIQQIMEARWTT
jgi:transcriptional regulator with XRE-family HTH domain